MNIHVLLTRTTYGFWQHSSSLRLILSVWHQATHSISHCRHARMYDYACVCVYMWFQLFAMMPTCMHGCYCVNSCERACTHAGEFLANMCVRAHPHVYWVGVNSQYIHRQQKLTTRTYTQEYTVLTICPGIGMEAVRCYGIPILFYGPHGITLHRTCSLLALPSGLRI